MSIIDQIKYKMIEKHITEEKLSNMIGCSQILLNKYLNEEEDMPVMISNNIIKVLDINTTSLQDRFNSLNEEDKNKVLEYIEFLQYKEKKLLKKTNNS